MRQALWAVVQLSRAWICAQLPRSGARVLLNYARVLVGLEKEVPSGQTQPQGHSRGSFSSRTHSLESRVWTEVQPLSSAQNVCHLGGVLTGEPNI